MITTQDLVDQFNNAGLDTPEKLAAFLKPAAISAQLADYDGRIAAIRAKAGAVAVDLQSQEEALVAEREEVRAKLQGDSEKK